MAKFISLTQKLEHHAFQKPDKTAFTFLKENDIQETLTYYQLVAKSQAVASRIKANIKKGERVVLIYPPGMDFIISFTACLYAGVIPVPVPPPNNKNLAFLLSIAVDACASHALTTTGILSRLETLDNKNKLSGYFRSYDNFFEKQSIHDLKWITTNEIDRVEICKETFANLQENAIAYLQYTSGSTAYPKGVIIAHSNIFNNSLLIKDHFRITDHTHLVSWLPTYHDMGLMGGLIAPLYAGISTTFLSPASFFKQPAKWLQTISNSRNLGDTTSGGPGFAYDLCLKQITDSQLCGLDLSNWKQAFVGAEPVRPHILEKFNQRFSPYGFKQQSFLPVYGLAESTLLIAAASIYEAPVIKDFEVKKLERNIVSVSDDECQVQLQRSVGCGSIMKGHSIAIVNPDTLHRCKYNEIGEIWIKGPSIAQGYWMNFEETEKSFQACIHGSQEGQFFRSGDMGFFKNGQLFITGRLKDLIFIKGRKLHPQDIELSASNAHPYLRSSSCTAFSLDEEHEEKLVIIHEMPRTYQRNYNLQNVVNCIVQSILDDHAIDIYAIVLTEPSSIPKTSSGKLQRQACKKQFQVGTLKTIYEWSAKHKVQADALMVC